MKQIGMKLLGKAKFNMEITEIYNIVTWILLLLVLVHNNSEIGKLIIISCWWKLEKNLP